MISRKEKIAAGKIWQVYTDANKETILHEGSRSSCMKFIRDKFGVRQWKRGLVRTAQVIWELDNQPDYATLIEASHSVAKAAPTHFYTLR